MKLFKKLTNKNRETCGIIVKGEKGLAEAINFGIENKLKFVECYRVNDSDNYQVFFAATKKAHKKLPYANDLQNCIGTVIKIKFNF